MRKNLALLCYFQYARDMILGIDEVGRGPWAGPLVVGAVVLGDKAIDGITDSKKLSKRKREALAAEINSSASVGLGWVAARELDEIGLSHALRAATKRAVEQIRVPYHEIIIDGTSNFLADTSKGAFVTTMKKADLLIPAVGAASIVAKVARDEYMTKQAKHYPEYGLDSNAGYGTVKHIAAIEANGVTPLHRLSFAPLAKYRGIVQDEAASAIPTTKSIGDAGETVVVCYLEQEGHTIIARNWRTKYCEIDIVSCQNDRIYFTEVKYRKTSKNGDGFDAITTKKQEQMRFAAKLFLAKPKFRNKSAVLCAASVSGNPPKLLDIVELR